MTSGGARSQSQCDLKLMSNLVKATDRLAKLVHFRHETVKIEVVLTWPLWRPCWGSLPSSTRFLLASPALYSSQCLIRFSRPDFWTWPPRESWASRSCLSVVGDTMPFVSCHDIYTRSTSTTLTHSRKPSTVKRYQLVGEFFFYVMSIDKTLLLCI